MRQLPWNAVSALCPISSLDGAKVGTAVLLIYVVVVTTTIIIFIYLFVFCYYCLLGERNFSFTLVGNQDDLLFESGSEISIKGLHLLGFELK